MGRVTRRWSQAEDQILRDRYPGSSDRELCDLLPGRTLASIQCRASIFDLKKSAERMAVVNSRKGAHLLPPEGRPIGSTHRKGRYVLIKVGMPDVWIPLHIHVWQEANGPVPDGMKVCAMDGDPANAVLDNLVLRTNAENQIKTHANYKGLPEEILDILHLQNEIKKTIKRRTKNEEQAD